jgi:hypothetical protein
VHKRNRTLGNAARRFIELLRQDPSVFPSEAADAPATRADVPALVAPLTDEPPAPAAPPPITSEAGAVQSKKRRLSSHR